jgi:hypothetical protein
MGLCMLIYIAAWLPMVAIAIGNGLLREKLYGKRMAEIRAHQLSTLSGMLLLGIYIGFVMGTRRPASGCQAIQIGLVWALLTVAFEFGFGRYAAGHTWKRLRQDYNVFKGRVWPALLIWVAIAPYLYYRLFA